jgi:ZIP family zinc transporter
MELVIMVAIGVGSSTVIGALSGLLFKDISPKWNNAILGFSAGVMLAAAIMGLILPSAEAVGKEGIWITALGMLLGALFLNAADKLTPHLHSLTGVDQENHANNASLDRVMLFVMAIALHNIPEGMAAGVGFASEDVNNAIFVALGIAIQNVPEGLVTVSPMLLNGVSKKRALGIAIITGMLEVVGTFIGYFSAGISAMILPFAMAFAGGTMLYVVSDEMIPETHRHGFELIATYAIIIGFILMLFMDVFLG